MPNGFIAKHGAIIKSRVNEIECTMISHRNIAKPLVGAEPVVYGLYCFQCYNFKCEYSFLLLIISQGNYKLMIKKNKMKLWIKSLLLFM